MDKYVFLLLLFAFWALAEMRDWKKRGRRIKLARLALALTAVYLSLVFCLQPDLPGYGELLKWAYGPAARTVVQWFGASS
ncbi:hypothetical protein [Cohnella zeiphila]|uniref:Uncharacterized protein n=1 Tax=Cohnella zeiphila TaxID=2761120 RepID=A0A7X0VXN3_9BACL|nr:hypothetical protein [Cohnella zeiphila]MBB6733795.1 hypothetical protein [Cohnella zeiphila]